MNPLEINLLEAIFWVVGIISFSGGVLFILSWVQIKWKYKKEAKRDLPSHSSKVSIIVPCKEIDKNFYENVKAICNQNYENFQIIFIADSTSDPAFEELEKTVANNPKVSITISDMLEGCSGKNSALIKGIKGAKDPDIYVFADADIKPHKDWLLHLVSPLYKEGVGATTGYRWYFPHDFQSLLTSVWNASVASVLFYDFLNFAWGGSTAIRKKLFEELRVADAWKNELVDDLILTKILKEHGYKIEFVPSCIIESYEKEDLHHLMKWTATQMSWVRHYFPSLWKVAFLINIGLRFANITGIVLIFTGYPIIGFLMFSPVIFDFVRGWQEFDTFKLLMNYPREKFGSVLAHAITRPFVSFIISYNLLSSLFMREIEWEGRIYKFN